MNERAKNDIAAAFRCGECGVAYGHLNTCSKAMLTDTPVFDAVSRPKHYTSHPSGVECIQVTEHMGFNLGNVIKYLWRAEEKGAPLEDLKKAAWYLQREIEKRERMEPVRMSDIHGYV